MNKISGDVKSINPSKKIMIFVNPHSGKGKANEVFLGSVDVLTAAGFEVVKFTTKRRNHASDHIRDMPADEFKSFFGFVTISGDGLPHEIINGFFSRPDY